MEWYAAIKKNKIMLFAGKWMELEVTVFKGSKPLPGNLSLPDMFSLMCRIWGRGRT
jgi:hypothetical protein